MKKKLVITNDGSHSIFVPQLNECYHSRHGSILEAEYVFIKNGLLAENKKQFNILEIGFGTGLNALLTAEKAKQKGISVNYHAIELHPVAEEYYRQLNFTELIGIEKGDFIQLHKAEWEEKCKINDHFSLTKNQISLEEYKTDKKFDIIYFDAFSPEKQPELWTDVIFKKMHDLLNEDGFLVTYCAKGVVKRTMKTVGFEVVVLDGPPGKRQMTRANKSIPQK